MRIKIVGIEPVDYFSKKENRQKLAVNLYPAMVDTPQGVRGMKFPFFGRNKKTIIFITEDVPNFKELVDMPVGAVVDAYYNQYGDIDAVSIVSTPKQ